MRRAWLLSLACLGCGDAPKTEIKSPPDTQARWLLLSIRSETGLEVRAFERPDRSQVLAEIEDADASIAIAMFDEDLGDFGMRSGVVPHEPTRISSRPLPSPRSSKARDEEGNWTEAPFDLAEFRYPSPCGWFEKDEAQDWTLRSGQLIRSVVFGDSDSVLVFESGNHLTSYSGSGRQDISLPEVGTDGFIVRLFRSSSGRLLASTDGGNVFESHVANDTLAFGTELREHDASIPFALAMLDDGSSTHGLLGGRDDLVYYVETYERSSWVRTATLTDVPTDTRVNELGQGIVLTRLLEGTSHYLHAVDQGRLRVIDLPVISGSFTKVPSSVGYSSTLGLAFGTTGGDIYAWDGQNSTLVNEEPLEGSVLALESQGSEWTAVLASGLLMQFDPALGACPETRIFDRELLLTEATMAFAGDNLVVGANILPGTSQLTYLHRR